MARLPKSSSTREGQRDVINQYNNPWEQVSSDNLAWNDFVSGLGMRMAHYIYAPYVVGATDTGSLRNYDEQSVAKKNDNLIYDNNGVYQYAGDVYVIWQGNSKNLTQLPTGYYPDSTATVTVNRHYINTDTIIGLSEFDKLSPILSADENPLEYASVNWEQYKHNPAGIDRLMFKAVQIEFLMDANGIQYTQGVDYTLDQGNVKWLKTGTQPGINNLSGEGMIMSIRYRYLPTFYIKYAAHELRSHATIDPNTGEKKMKRLPMTAGIQIDWVFLQSLKNQESSGDSTVNAGTGGNTGPR